MQEENKTETVSEEVLGEVKATLESVAMDTEVADILPSTDVLDILPSTEVDSL
jgi:hypothetical protein